MKLKDVQQGKFYRAKVSGKMTTLQVIRIDKDNWDGKKYFTRIYAKNTATGREIVMRSAARLREEV